ncbi:MAG: nuclear transport factor 2 family protein [Acidobacteriota bacterium]
MNANENKQLMKNVFAELSNRNSKPFGEILDDDVRWTIIGTTKWSKTYDGKQSVYEDLLEPLFARFANQYKGVAKRIIAEDDYVVVEAHGNSKTNAGEDYNNEYCYIFRFDDGKVSEITEYCDTALIERTLG